MEGMAPRWPGLKSPWAIISPRALKSAAEKSRPSRTACEYAVWRSDAPPTPRAGGPVLRAPGPRSGRAPALDPQVPVPIDDRLVAGQENHRRLALFDHRGALHGNAGAEAVAIVDAAVDEAAALREIHGPRLLGRAPGRDGSGSGHGHDRNATADLELPVGRLERRPRRFGIAVARRIDGGVRPLDRGERLRTEAARGNLHAELVPLPRIAHFGEPARTPLASQPRGGDLGGAVGFHGHVERIDFLP